MRCPWRSKRNIILQNTTFFKKQNIILQNNESKSNQCYSYSQESKLHCLSGLYSLYSDTSSVLRPSTTLRKHNNISEDTTFHTVEKENNIMTFYEIHISEYTLILLKKKKKSFLKCCILWNVVSHCVQMGLKMLLHFFFSSTARVIPETKSKRQNRSFVPPLRRHLAPSYHEPWLHKCREGLTWWLDKCSPVQQRK